MMKKINFDKIGLYDLFKIIQTEINKGFVLSNILVQGYPGNLRYYGELHFIKKDKL